MNDLFSHMGGKEKSYRYKQLCLFRDRSLLVWEREANGSGTRLCPADKNKKTEVQQGYRPALSLCILHVGIVSSLTYKGI